MKINKIKLTNFRNYENVEIEFLKGVNIILGDNGVGKTNLVEAIDFLTIGKSFKTNDEKEMIKFDQNFAKVHLEMTRKEKIELDCVISQAGKRFMFNDIELKKLSEEDLISVNDDNIKLTNKGIDLANLVWEEFVN